MSKQVRTRIAPSPTGEDLHIGNAYTALINYVFARKNTGQFIVRIEDTDRSRIVEGAQKSIFDSLDWLGLTPDESLLAGGVHQPYRQSERLNLYQQYVEELIAKGHAYRCTCTPERLASMRKKQQKAGKPPLYDGKCRKAKNADGQGSVVRLKTPQEGTTPFTDVVRGEIAFENALIDDQVLLKSDGFPTYHLAVVVDDHLMQISHVIRGEEWISSTPKHVLLYAAFGWELPVFAHLPLLRNPDTSKLSKRRNPVWTSWYRDRGFLPEAVLNYLATLGWAPPAEILEKNKAAGVAEELFSLEDMQKHFRLEDIKTSAPIFDIEKLRWMNGEYIRKAQSSKLKVQIYEFFEHRYARDMIEKILPLVQQRLKTLAEFAALAGFFFAEPEGYDIQINSKWIGAVVNGLADVDWNHTTLLQTSRSVAAELDIAFGKLAMDIRVAITGKTVGPPLFESMELLGKQVCLARLKKFL